MCMSPIAVLENGVRPRTGVLNLDLSCVVIELINLPFLSPRSPLTQDINPMLRSKT